LRGIDRGDEITPIRRGWSGALARRSAELAFVVYVLFRPKPKASARYVSLCELASGEADPPPEVARRLR
jgi:hypothetical protein